MYTYLNDMTKKSVVQVQNICQVPKNAIYKGDSNRDGIHEYAADTNGNGFIDTVFEIVANVTGWMD